MKKDFNKVILAIVFVIIISPFLLALLLQYKDSITEVSGSVSDDQCQQYATISDTSNQWGKQFICTNNQHGDGITWCHRLEFDAGGSCQIEYSYSSSPTAKGKPHQPNIPIPTTTIQPAFPVAHYSAYGDSTTGYEPKTINVHLQ